MWTTGNDQEDPGCVEVKSTRKFAALTSSAVGRIFLGNATRAGAEKGHPQPEREADERTTWFNMGNMASNASRIMRQTWERISNSSPKEQAPDVINDTRVSAMELSESNVHEVEPALQDAKEEDGEHLGGESAGSERRAATRGCSSPGTRVPSPSPPCSNSAEVPQEARERRCDRRKRAGDIIDSVLRTTHGAAQ